MGKKKFAFKIYPLDKDLAKRWHIDFYFEGKYGVVTRGKRFVSEKFKTLKEKEKEVARIIAEIEIGYQPKPKMKVVHYVNTAVKYLYEYLQTKTLLRSKSLSSYRSHIRNFEKYCIDTKTARLSAESGTAFLNHLRGSKSSATVNNHRRTLLQAFRYLKKKRLVSLNIFDNTKAFREQKGGANYFKTFQRAFLKDKILEMDPPLWLAIQFVYYCFIRTGNELTGLKVADVDLDRNLLTVRGENSKNKDTELVAIPVQLQKELIRLGLHKYPPQYYLVGKEGVPSENRLSVNHWGKRHLAVMKKAKFQYSEMKYSIYSWKHTGVVLLAQNNVPLIKIQRQLRHKDISTTQKYMKSLGISDMGDLQNSFPSL